MGASRTISDQTPRPGLRDQRLQLLLRTRLYLKKYREDAPSAFAATKDPLAACLIKWHTSRNKAANASAQTQRKRVVRSRERDELLNEAGQRHIALLAPKEETNKLGSTTAPPRQDATAQTSAPTTAKKRAAGKRRCGKYNPSSRAIALGTRTTAEKTSRAAGH